MATSPSVASSTAASSTDVITSESSAPDETVATDTVPPGAATTHEEGSGTVRPANTLAITAAVLGGLGAVCALSVVWFFAAIPLGIAAIVCAVVDRRRRRSRGETRAAGASTAGLVLGVAVLPMALGAVLMIPRVEHVAERAASALQGGVKEDLDSLERTTTRNVDSLDDTLTHLVDETDKGFRHEIRSLERSTKDDMIGMERSVRASVDEADKANAAELERLEASLREDVRMADGRAASVEAELRVEINELIAEINQLKALYAQSQSGR